MASFIPVDRGFFISSRVFFKMTYLSQLVTEKTLGPDEEQEYNHAYGYGVAHGTAQEHRQYAVQDTQSESGNEYACNATCPGQEYDHEDLD
jgi:hypothetical protein